MSHGCPGCDGCLPADGAEVLTIPILSGDLIFYPEETEHGTPGVHALHNPCGPDVNIPVALWRRLLALTPQEIATLRDWTARVLP